DVNVAIRDNKLELVLGFLTKHIHQFGSLKPADEIIYNMCGEYVNSSASTRIRLGLTLFIAL
ncbi:hypothetical protein EXW66_09765, partial [Francisella tularensis subsp. holarctica]